jgi:hypothetical protein
MINSGSCTTALKLLQVKKYDEISNIFNSFPKNGGVTRLLKLFSGSTVM